MTIGGIYELDNVRYQCISIKECGLGIFQELNEDGTFMIEWNTNSEGKPTYIKDSGKRIIWQRISELKEIKK